MNNKPWHMISSYTNFINRNQIQKMANARSITILFSVLLWAFNDGHSQNQPGTELHIKKAIGTIELDGRLDESDWQTADLADDWYTNYPVDTLRAPFQTEARFTFDDEFFCSFVLFGYGIPI